MSEWFTESRAGSPHDYTPKSEAKKIPPTGDTGKTPLTEQVEDFPVNEQKPAHMIAEEDDVVELHMGTEDLLVPCELVPYEIKD